MTQDLYNLTAMTSATNLAELARGTNTILQGYWFGNFVLVTIFLVAFIYMVSKGNTKLSACAGGVWLITIVSLFLLPLDLISSQTMWICVFLTPVTLIALWLSGRGD